MGEENFFKEKVFPPPNPHLSKTLNVGLFFCLTHLLTGGIGRFVADLGARFPTF